MVTSILRVPLQKLALVRLRDGDHVLRLGKPHPARDRRFAGRERESEHRHLGLRVLRREQIKLGDVVLSRHRAFDVELVGHDVAVLGQLRKIDGEPLVERFLVAEDGLQHIRELRRRRRRRQRCASHRSPGPAGAGASPAGPSAARARGPFASSRKRSRPGGGEHSAAVDRHGSPPQRPNDHVQVWMLAGEFERDHGRYIGTF